LQWNDLHNNARCIALPANSPSPAYWWIPLNCWMEGWLAGLNAQRDT
jgi:hypothetical protein